VEFGSLFFLSLSFFFSFFSRRVLWGDKSFFPLHSSYATQLSHRFSQKGPGQAVDGLCAWNMEHGAWRVREHVSRSLESGSATLTTPNSDTPTSKFPSCVGAWDCRPVQFLARVLATGGSVQKRRWGACVDLYVGESVWECVCVRVRMREREES
jgi:hypothetical protein